MRCSSRAAEPLAVPCPGDMIIRPGDFVFYSPLGLTIVLSVALATLNLYLRR